MDFGRGIGGTKFYLKTLKRTVDPREYRHRTAIFRRCYRWICPSRKPSRERELGTHEFGPPYVRES